MPSEQNGSDSGVLSVDTEHRNGSNRPMLQKFNGTTRQTRPDLWINLFELLTDGYSDQNRIIMLMSYLTDDALNWFASEVVPHRATKTWEQVKIGFFERFGVASADPLVEAQHRRYRRDDTIQKYYDEKISLLRQTNLTEHEKISQLTDGMPWSWKPHFISSSLTSTVNWLSKALQLETVLRKPEQQKGKQNYQSRQRPLVAAPVSTKPMTKQWNKNKDDRPPAPCKICAAAGKPDEYHWHRQCPRANRDRNNDKNKQSEQNYCSADVPAMAVETSTWADQGNFLGGRQE